MFGKETYTSLVLRAVDEQAAVRLKDFFNLEFKKAAVQALLEREYFASLAETNKQFLVAVVFVAVVMAVGGVFGVMNTMFAAISQRTKDIGVLRLLGFARWQILASFLLESLVIGLVGGALGLRARLALQRLDGQQHRLQRPGRSRQVRGAGDVGRRQHPDPGHPAVRDHGRPGRRSARDFRRPAAPLEALR